MSQFFDLVVVGAGAAGLMCAARAASRGKKVLVLDHANKAGKKILMSGGGRCNFTNYHIESSAYLCSNPHFVKSALARYTQWDFIALVDKYGIQYHEKELGQLFCNDSAKEILHMLLSECQLHGVEIRLKTSIEGIERLGDETTGDRFSVTTASQSFHTPNLVIASGGLSIPTLGASNFGYLIAKQFGLEVLPTRAALVPFTMPEPWLREYAELSGTAVEVKVSCNQTTFSGNLLFTHRGISGPAILQISSYWQLGDTLSVDLLPQLDAETWLKQMRQEKPEILLSTVLATQFSKKLAHLISETWFSNKPLKQFSAKDFSTMAEQLHRWQVKPHGTEGYRTAEVTLGGVDVNQISSKTMEVKNIPGLYFIGEVLDVSGHLGGFNFQWAWSSAVAAADSL